MRGRAVGREEWRDRGREGGKEGKGVEVEIELEQQSITHYPMCRDVAVRNCIVMQNLSVKITGKALVCFAPLHSCA